MKLRTRRRPSIELLESRALLTAGALDATFGTGGYLSNPASALGSTRAVVEPWDDKLIVAGGDAIYRYNPNGTPDTSFGVGGMATVNIDYGSTVSEIVPNLATQQIYLVGVALVKGTNGVEWHEYAVSRLNNNGTLDTSFGSGGSVTVAVGATNTWDSPAAASLDSQGRLVVVGSGIALKSSGYQYQDSILRFTPQGQLDTTFNKTGEVNGPVGVFTYDGWNLVQILPGDSITVEGQQTTSVNGVNVAQQLISTYSSTGTLVHSNQIQPPADPYDPSQTIGLGTVAFLPNGDLISSQSLADAPNNDVVVSVARYTPSGTLDTTYGSGGLAVTDLTTTLGYPTGSLSYGGPSCLTIDPSGDVVLGGDFEPYTKVNGVLVFGTNQEMLVRYTPAGVLDSSFGNGGAVLNSLVPFGSSAITTLSTQPDGSILALGWSNPTNGSDATTSSVTTLARYLGSSGPSVVVTQEPTSPVTAGSPFGLTVEAEDSSGNLLSTYNGPVTLALAVSPGGASLGGTVTATATNGVAVFSGLTLDTASEYTLSVAAAGLVTGLTSGITVTPAAPSQIVITQEPPGTIAAGESFSYVQLLEAFIEDPYGNVVTTAGTTVTASLAANPGGTTLDGTLTSTSGSTGEVIFSPYLTKAAAGYTIELSCPGLASAVTTDITVTPAAASTLLIVQEPSSVVVNTGFVLIVEAVDAYGNLVSSDNNTVKVALGNNPSGAKLGGTTSLTFVNGVATFSGLTLNKVGTGYTILISSKNLTGVTTDPFNVTAS